MAPNRDLKLAMAEADAEMAGTTFSAVPHLRMVRTGCPKGSRYSRWMATILMPLC